MLLIIWIYTCFILIILHHSFLFQDFFIFRVYYIFQYIFLLSRFRVSDQYFLLYNIFFRYLNLRIHIFIMCLNILINIRIINFIRHYLSRRALLRRLTILRNFFRYFFIYFSFFLAIIWFFFFYTMDRFLCPLRRFFRFWVFFFDILCQFFIYNINPLLYSSFYLF